MIDPDYGWVPFDSLKIGMVIEACWTKKPNGYSGTKWNNKLVTKE